jgi:hypothetical protein
MIKSEDGIKRRGDFFWSLAPFFQPLQNLITKVTTLVNDIKTDVMNFYNVSCIISLNILINL